MTGREEGAVGLAFSFFFFFFWGGGVFWCFGIFFVFFNVFCHVLYYIFIGFWGCLFWGVEIF